MPVLHTLLASLKKALPTRESLAQHRWLRPVAHHLLQPQLWRVQQESVARGAAIGTFWAFVIPLGQTFVAAAHCTWWRGNIPTAAVMTLLTNPLTFGFWLWLAYPVGKLFMDAPVPTQALPDSGWASTLQEVGGPVLLGMGIFGVGGAALAYFLVKLGWRLHVAVRRHRSNRDA